MLMTCLTKEIFSKNGLSDGNINLQARIKKIMQADEDVGKIALAVPVLVCELLLLAA
jgi:hypothetical protein